MLQKKFPPFKHSYIAPVQNEIKTTLIAEVFRTQLSLVKSFILLHLQY